MRGFFTIKKKLFRIALSLAAVLAIIAPTSALAFELGDIGKGVGDFFGGVGKVVGDVGNSIGQGIAQVSKFTVPGTNTQVDLTKGLAGLQEIANMVPDKVNIPGTSLFIYPKKTVEENIVQNIAPFLSDTVNILDPFKPAASIARTVLQFARPHFDKWIKPILPDLLKSGAHTIKQKIGDVFAMINVPIIKDVVLPLWNFVIGPIGDLAYEVVDMLAEESRAAPAPNADTPSEPGQMIFSSPVVNQKPVGSFDVIEGGNLLVGWAADPDTPAEAVKVYFVLDNALLLGESVTANHQISYGQYAGLHGFRVAIPRAWYDGKPHTVEAWAEDSSGEWSEKIMLPGSPKTFQLFNKAAGNLEPISQNGEIRGWALTPGIGSPAEVQLSINGWPQRHVGPEWQGTVLSIVKAKELRTDIALETIQKFGGTNQEVGFSASLDGEIWLGGHYPVYAVVKERHSVTGQIQEVLLPGSPQYFFRPRTFSLQFKEDPIKVAQDSWVIQSVSGIPNADHFVEILLDNELVDANEHVRASYGGQQIGKTLHIYEGKGAYLSKRAVDFRFKIPRHFPVGSHTVKVRQTNPELGFVYEGVFTIMVTPPITVEAIGHDLIAGESSLVRLRSFPKLATMLGKSPNTGIVEILLGTNPGQTNGKRGYESAVVSIKDIFLRQGNLDEVIASFTVPKDASSLVNGKGPVHMYVVLEAKDEVSRGEFVAHDYPYRIRVPVITEKGKDPILESICISTLQPKIFLTDDLAVSGEGFGCHQKITAIISGESLGKTFSVDVVPSNIAEEGKGAVAQLYQTKTLWNGTLAQYAHVYINHDAWMTQFGDAEKMTITLKDEDGRSASATVDVPAGIVVVPPADGVIYPGSTVAVRWRGLRSGARVSLKVDGNEVKKTYVDEAKPWKKIDEILVYTGLIDDVRIPEDTPAGVRIFSIGSLKAPFMVQKKKLSEVVTPKKAEPKSAPKILVEPQPKPPTPSPVPIIVPEPTPVIPTPEPAPTPKKVEEVPTTPTCPTGSTYSFTFKQCMEDTPTQRSPYDGLPCPGDGVPNYAKLGCIPQ